MAKRKFQITQPHVVDGNNNPIPIGTVITINGELPALYVNKGIFISADGSPDEKELINATPEETAVEKQSRLNRARKSKSRVIR